jgi:cytoskeleton protein RodZ
MAPEIGEALREARIRRGIEFREVERATRIRVRYLRAMEQDRWEVLPGPAYARGFLATYAHFLGIDPSPLVEEYRRLHQSVEALEPIPEEMLPRPGVVRRRPLGTSAAVLAGLVALAGLGVVLVLGLTGDSGNDRERAGRAAQTRGGDASPATTVTTEAPEPPSEHSVWLRSTGTVWVCLMDDRGRALVNGETLTADEARGPFEAETFQVTLGNGSVELVVDDEPVGIPEVAEPLGYEITARGLSEMDPSERPTCL